MHFSLPDQFPRSPVQAKDGLILLAAIRRGEIDVIPHHGGRTVAASRQRRFPQNIFALGPLNRWLLSGRCDPIARRTTPARPVVRGVNGRSKDIRRPRENDQAEPGSGKSGPSTVNSDLSEHHHKFEYTGLSQDEPNVSNIFTASIWDDKAPNHDAGSLHTCKQQREP